MVVYTREGRVLQQFDYSKDPTEKEFTVATSNPNGQVVVIGSYNRLRILTWSQRKGLFEESEPKEIENFYTITSLSWKKDGSKLAVVGYHQLSSLLIIIYIYFFLIHAFIVNREI